MALKPFSITRKASEMISGAEERFLDLEHDFLVQIGKFLGRDDLLQLYKTDRAGAMAGLREAFQGIADKNWNASAKREFNDGFNAFVENSLKTDEAIHQRALEAGADLRKPPPLSSSTRLMGTLEVEYKRIVDVMDRIGMTGTETALATLDRHLSQAATGAESIDQAIRGAMAEFAEAGVTGYRYPSGASISMAPYARRELVTNMMNLARELGFERAKDWGSDLIQISAHAGARPGCFPYQGRVFSLERGHEKHMALEDTSYGEPAGIFGINCRHFCWPFFEGLNDEYTADQKDPARLLGPTNSDIYEATETQRYNERRIRKFKRQREELAAAGMDTGKADRKIKYWQKRQRAFIEDSQDRNIDLRRDYLREKV